MTAFAFSTHGLLLASIIRMGREYTRYIWGVPLRSPMSIFLSLGGDLKNARRDTEE